MRLDLTALRRLSTADLIRDRLVNAEAAAGVLWARLVPTIELSAYGPLAWDGRPDKPAHASYEWTGLNLLCSAAPTAFELDGLRYASVESFHHALKLPEGAERDACAVASGHDARARARRRHGRAFTYQGRTIAVDSAEHEALIGAAISAKVRQRKEVQLALAGTGARRLAFPGSTYAGASVGVLARVTPLALMIERWKLTEGTR